MAKSVTTHSPEIPLTTRASAIRQLRATTIPTGSTLINAQRGIYVLSINSFAQNTEPLWSIWGNNTCLPTTDKNSPCTYGTHPRYVIDAKTVHDIQIGINWARNLNIRLVIRNTGHDFLGKSMGTGSLSIWTHNFKSINFINSYNGPGGYSGSAVKVGAGVQTRDLYAAASAKGKIVVGGECAVS